MRFRSKRKIDTQTIVTTIKELDPDKAFKYLDSLPNFANHAKDIVNYFYTICETGLKDSKKQTIRSLILIIDDLDAELKSGDYSYETKCDIIDKMIEVGNLISKEEAKQHLERITWFTLLVAAFSIVFRAFRRFL